MRWTQAFIPTLKETPAEAEIPSHKLLLRAGLIRKLTGGLYTFLPLGLRSLRKIEQIVRQEMDRAGALELLMPALQPPEIWQQSGRYETMRDVLFKLRDRAKREWLLGPTHEEVITSLVAGEINSYRQLPKNFYQIQTKFRDEIRPRFGLMRAKEFIMKDAYSFDATDEAAQLSYQKMSDAYTRIFQRCGLKVKAVEADTGVIGGKFSHEFMAPAETGEDEVVFCEACSYAANLEKAMSRGPATASHSQPAAGTSPPPPEKFPTPGVLTIEALARPPYHVAGAAQVKTLVYLVESRLVLILLRGDDQLNEAKLSGVLGATKSGQFGRGGSHAASSLRRLRLARRDRNDHRSERGWFSFPPGLDGARHHRDPLGRPARDAGRRSLPAVRRAVENPARDRGWPRLQTRHEIQPAAQRVVPRRIRPAAAGSDGLLRPGHHAHVAGDHRAMPRPGRHHLAVVGRALRRLPHATEREARQPSGDSG